MTARVAAGQLDGDLLAANAGSLPRELQAAVGAGLVHRGQREFLGHPVTQGTLTGLSLLAGGGYFQLGVKASYYPRAKGVGVVVTRAEKRLTSLDAHVIRLGGRTIGNDLFLLYGRRHESPCEPFRSAQGGRRLFAFV